MDDRFSKANFDPRFIRYKKNASKLKIDDRFKSMLTSKEFDSTSVAKVDKYGRKTSQSVQKDLKKYYKLDSQEDDEESEELTQSKGYLLARGEAGVESSSEEEDSLEKIIEEENEDQEEDGFMSHISQSIPTGDETHRLAVVNLDWDHVTSNDIYKLFQGFVPPNGLLKSVCIYPSEFGKERMAMELTAGPPSSIFHKESDDQQVDKLIKEDAGIEYDKLQLRKYEIEKLKYYYAIAEFDSKETARAIYEACDGAEFESSGNFLDLRYVPMDTEFNQEEAK